MILYVLRTNEVSTKNMKILFLQYVQWFWMDHMFPGGAVNRQPGHRPSDMEAREEEHLNGNPSLSLSGTWERHEPESDFHTHAISHPSIPRMALEQIVNTKARLII